MNDLFLRPSIQPFYIQIDKEKVKAAVAFVEFAGNGSQVFFTQEIKEQGKNTEERKFPYNISIYVRISLRQDFYEVDVYRYGGLPHIYMREAVNIAVEEILTDTTAIIKEGENEQN